MRATKWYVHCGEIEQIRTDTSAMDAAVNAFIDIMLGEGCTPKVHPIMTVSQWGFGREEVHPEDEMMLMDSVIEAADRRVSEQYGVQFNFKPLFENET